MIRRIKLLGVLSTVLIMAGCIPSHESKLIKIYQSKFDFLIGKNADEVFPVVTSQWKFKFMSKWASINPTQALVLKMNHHRAPFSNKEMEEVFKEKGHYQVMFCIKKSSEGSTRNWHMEEDMWLTSHEHSHNCTRYVLIRMVFLDNKLRNYRFFRFEVSN